MQGDDLELTPRCLEWVKALRGFVRRRADRPRARLRASRRLVQGVRPDRPLPITVPAPSPRAPDDDRGFARTRGSRPSGPRTRRGSCRPATRRGLVRAARTALREHLPELVPTWERLCRLAGGGDTASRVLAHWCPPPHLSGCTQAVVRRARPILVRNYDYDVRRFDATILLDGLRRPARARHRRLHLGPARRHERGRPRGDAHVRRLARGRHGLRHLDRDALPARDLHDRGRGAHGARPRAGAHGVQRDGAGRRRGRRRPRSSARAGRRCTSIRWW